MEKQEIKSVIIVDKELPVGMIANTVSILGMTLGKRNPELIGCDIKDQDGKLHMGITEIPIPVLMAETSNLQEIRIRLFDEKYEDLKVVDFSSVAQSCKAYDDYITKMNNTKMSDLQYWGVAVWGSAKKINKLTGNLPLLR